MSGEPAWPEWETNTPIRPTDLSRTESLARAPRTPAVSVVESAGVIKVTSPKLTIEISRDPYTLSVVDATGEAIVSGARIPPGIGPDSPKAMYGPLGFRLQIPERGLWSDYHHFSSRELWFQAVAVESWRETPGGLEVIARTNDPFGRTISLEFSFVSQTIVRVWARVSDTTSLTGMAASFNAAPDDPFYGLGERFTACNQRGQDVLAWSSAGPTGRKDWTYWPTPFVLTGAGYGLLLDSVFRNRFRLCTDFRQMYCVETEAPELVLYFVCDKDPLAIIEGLTELAGKPPMPPMWSFGVIRNINGSEKRVREEAQKLRAADIPCSAIWFYDALDEARHMGWPINPRYFDGDYDDVARLTRDLKTMGYRSQTYFLPYFYVNTQNYDEGAAKGYFVRNPHGDPYLIPFHTVDYDKREPIKRMAAIIDFTNPGAVAWYQEFIRQIVVDLDFDGWMHDFGEDVPADAVFYNGKSGAEMHNIFPTLYKKATYEACLRHKPDVSYYARAGYAGSQGYTMALWTGDQVINWDYDSGLPSVIPGALNLGICGVPYIGPDIAGYFNTDPAPDSEELWIRWLQLGALTPVMRDLVAYYSIELWTSERTVEAFRVFARLHMSLAPYLYSYARQAHETGAPIMRHLFLEYPDDRNVISLDYQFMLGRDLLVAPVLSPGVSAWTVYLPAGRWHSWWDNQAYNGPGWVEVPAPLMQIPLLAKAGAIVPLFPPDVDTLTPCDDPDVTVAGDALDIEIFPSVDGETRFQLWDGAMLTWDSSERRFSVSGSSIRRRYRVQLRNVPATVGEGLLAVHPDTLSASLVSDSRFLCAQLEGDNFSIQFPEVESVQ